MSPRIFWSRESGFSTKFPALQAIHAQNSAITGSTCRAESGFNSANDILTKRKGTLGPALFKSLALGKLNPDHFPSAASIRKRKLTPSGYNQTNTQSHNFGNRKTLLHWSGKKKKADDKTPQMVGWKWNAWCRLARGWGWGAGGWSTGSWSGEPKRSTLIYTTNV